MVLYLLHARNNNRALFSLKLSALVPFRWAWRGALPDVLAVHVALYDTGFPANWPRFLTVYAGLMMIPMVLGSMGMKRIVYRW